MGFLDEFRGDMKPMVLYRPGQTQTIEDFKPKRTAPPAPINFDGIIQRLRSRDLRFLPEGQDGSEARIVWAETELKLRDIIVDDEDSWTAIDAVYRHEEGGFWRAVVTRTEFDPLNP